jgi:DNA-binding NarL/FixJ family response regulator
LGKTSKEIARELGLSARTVEVYRAAILSKFDVGNTSSAVRVLVEAGSV